MGTRKDTKAVEVKQSFENATMHGLSKISASQSSTLRLAWSILVVSFVSMLSYQIYVIAKSYLQHPTVTTVKTFRTDKIEFPGVTICPSTVFRRSKVYYDINYMNFFDVQSNDKIDDYRFVTYGDYLAQYESIGKFWQANSRGKSLLVNGLASACQFGLNITCNYQTDFQEILTWSQGICYKFNPLERFVQVRPGAYYGLRLILFINRTDSVPFASLDTGEGVHIIVKPHHQFPFPIEEGIFAPVGFYTKISLNKVVQNRMKEPYGSKCTDGEGSELIFPGLYSITNCRESCIAKETMQSCGLDGVEPVKRYYLSKNNSYSASTTTPRDWCEWETDVRMQSEGFRSCDCGVPCKEEQFKQTVSYSNWPSYADTPVYEKTFEQALGSSYSGGAIRDNFLRVTIYFNELSYEEITERAEWSMQKIISDIGGQMGVWVGASILTVIELAILIWNVLAFVCQREANNNLNQDNDENINGQKQCKDKKKEILDTNNHLPLRF